MACSRSSLVNPWLRRWSSGITVGGPVKTNRLFFFGAYQRTFNEDNATGLSEMTVPSGLTDDRSAAGLEAADLSWGGSGSVAIDPVASTLLNTKLPNGQYLIPSTQNPRAPYRPWNPMCILIGHFPLEI